MYIAYGVRFFIIVKNGPTDPRLDPKPDLLHVFSKFCIALEGCGLPKCIGDTSWLLLTVLGRLGFTKHQKTVMSTCFACLGIRIDPHLIFVCPHSGVDHPRGGLVQASLVSPKSGAGACVGVVVFTGGGDSFD